MKTSGPSGVTAMVCSKWAERPPSAVTTLQLSSRVTVSGDPTLTMGSMAKTLPVLMVLPGESRGKCCRFF